MKSTGLIATKTQKTSPIVSVVSPVFNCEKYLAQFIESILSQSFQDWELILVDDGSTDKSVEIAQKYVKKDKRINCIRAAHENAGNARNIGLDVARGTYICFLDSDDYCKPMMLEKMVLAAQGKNADIVLCQSEFYSEKTHKTGTMSWSLVKNKIPQTEDKCFCGKDCSGYLFQTTIISPWNKLMRRDLLVKNQIRAQSQIAANDVVLSCMALACASRIYPKFERLYVQRRDNVNSITGNLSTSEKHKCGYTASLGLLQELKRVGRYEELKKTYQRLAIHNCIWYFLKNLDNLEILEKDYHFLQQEGLAELDLLDIDLSVLADNTEDMKVFLQIRDEPFYKFLYDQIKNAEKREWKTKTNLQKEIDQTRKQLQTIKNSKTYRAGEILLAVPKRVLNWYKKAITLHPLKRQDNNERYKNAHKRIAFMAFENYHYDVLAWMMKTCNINNNYIIAYVNQKAKTEADSFLKELSNLVEWHTYIQPCLQNKKTGELTYENCRKLFVKDVITRENLDYIILPSPEYHPDWYLPLVENRNRAYKVVAGAHNLNTVFFTKGNNPEVDNFYQLADEYCLIDSGLKETLLKSNIKRKNIHVFPPVFSPLPVRKLSIEEERVVFVVTGNVEEQRKDYQIVVKALKKIPEFHQKIKIVLLGKAITPYAQEIVSNLKCMEATGLEVVSYTTYIPQEEFDNVMFNSHCIIAPIVKETLNKGILEYYGSTKVSGAVMDIIRFALPAIVVSDLAMPEELSSSICRYDSADSLSKAICYLLKQDTLAEYIEKAKINSEKFLLEKFLWK